MDAEALSEERLELSPGEALVRRGHLIGVGVFSRRISVTRRGACLSRLLALHQLDAWGLPYGSRLSEHVAAVVAELASNAVLHGREPGRDFELRLVLDGEDEGDGSPLQGEVNDTRCVAQPPEKPTRPEADGEGGRGLLSVEAQLAVGRDGGARAADDGVGGAGLLSVRSASGMAAQDAGDAGEQVHVAAGDHEDVFAGGLEYQGVGLLPFGAQSVQICAGPEAADPVA